MLSSLRADRSPDRQRLWLVVDVLVAGVLVLLVVQQYTQDAQVRPAGGIEEATWALLLAPSVLVAVRRLAPLTTALAGAVCFIAAGFDAGDGNSVLAMPVLAWLVATTRPSRAAAILVALIALPVATTSLYGPGPDYWIGMVAILVVHGIVWYAGQRSRRAHVRTEALESDIAAAREEAATAAQEAVVEERRRIARELHDAVGHAVNVIVVQAAAGRFVTQDGPAREVLGRIEGVGRAALTDLDRMLGLLDVPTGDDAPRAPTHRTADVARLVEGVRATGADVRLEIDGIGDLDHATDAAVFRIVQEALTNAVKHAGPAHIDVTLAGTAQEVVVEVRDDGRGAAAARPRHGGRGLAGMRERVSVLGGRLEASPRPGGGFRVQARLPRSGAAS